MYELYYKIKALLKEFIDTKEENYDVITFWIIGTWLQDKFETFPYLFINAMKGSGKTRLLKLVKELSKGGEMLASLSEAVLFRTSGTLCIDEFENVGSKDKNSLRELLNTAYKKGSKVKRMKKVKNAEGEQQVVEEFSTFRPIVMANIWGMEEVLEDRCISIILEKSGNAMITRKIENFSKNPKVLELKKKLAELPKLVSLCRDIVLENIDIQWNTYIDNYNDTQQHTYTTTLNDNTTQLFNKIYDTNIDGRNLELSFPLLLIANEIGVVDVAVDLFKTIVNDKKDSDLSEAKDVMLYDFVSRKIVNEFEKINDLAHEFKVFINYEPEEETRNWLNSKWLGKALKRLNLIVEKKRMHDGRYVMLNSEKAREKLKIFKKAE